MSSVFFFFFFQAKDGIRDPLVTGVQTCALPIHLKYFLAKPVSSTKYFRSTPASGSSPPSFGSSEVAPEIGRASCRERVEIWVVGEKVKKKVREMDRMDQSRTGCK